MDWDWLWQRPHEIMSRFAADGNRVLYVDTLGVRSPNIRDSSRIIIRLRNWLHSCLRGPKCVRENLYVYSPVIVPFYRSTLVDKLNHVILVRSLRQLSAALNLSSPILWTYSPAPIALRLIQAMSHKLLVYDCTDAVAHNLEGVVGGIEKSEERLLRQADLVFATSHMLFEEKRTLSKHIYWVPSGVNFDRFATTTQSSLQDLSPIPRPRIAYFGQIDRRIDLELLRFVAASRPEWSLVIIGPTKVDITVLSELQNVYFLGMKAHTDLPAYLHGMDVFIMPYRVNEYTIHIYPAKIHECFATEKPVVATFLPELEPFSDVIRLAANEQQFARFVFESIREEDPALRHRRLEIARENSWASRYALMADKIRQCL